MIIFLYSGGVVLRKCVVRGALDAFQPMFGYPEISAGWYCITRAGTGPSGHHANIAGFYVSSDALPTDCFAIACGILNAALWW